MFSYLCSKWVGQSTHRTLLPTNFVLYLGETCFAVCRPKASWNALSDRQIEVARAYTLSGLVLSSGRSLQYGR
ncbi:hypothetical protein [Veronia pacifica]|uniref:hypothetical protein n=1 Tax=Veronia pacifica TaxID=1080227 RepID=UPI001112FEB5|nr:hypothetical protein [Veronia pacifica]